MQQTIIFSILTALVVGGALCEETTGACVSIDDAKRCLARLRATEFNAATELALERHAFVVAAEEGSLSLSALRRFAGEQQRIQRNDAVSFGSLAGFSEWRVADGGLVASTLPEGVGSDDIFGFLFGGELHAARLLVNFAAATGLDEAAFRPTASAQAYAAYWALLARDGKKAAAAAAAAVNFPAWGRACARVRDALRDRGTLPTDALAFLDFFATPIDTLDDMAATVIASEGVDCEDLDEPVRLLQEYELLFWDSVFAAGE